MPRPGGEADKLGNRYEGLWTVNLLLDLLNGEASEITVEPFGSDATGVELVLALPDGSREFHSLKRQRAHSEWRLADLCRPSSTGRSILGDLLHKQRSNPTAKAVFVSSTGANELRELAERAGRSDTLRTFDQHLDTSAELSAGFAQHLVPLASGRDAAFAMLKRLKVVLIDERQLARQVDQRISLMFYRPDGIPLDPPVVRQLLGDVVLDRLGQSLAAEVVWVHLRQSGYHRKDWALDPSMQDRVTEINRAYVRRVEAELINGQRIQRKEAKEACDFLSATTGCKKVMVVGTAGDGKSCVVAQTVLLLAEARVPHLVLRLDAFPEVPSTRAMGQAALGVACSPAVVLAGLAAGVASVLVIDQLDAVSIVSGRNPRLWDVFDTLMQEAAEYPRMSVLLACRAFDLEHDYRLRRLVAPNATVRKIELARLEVEQVKAGVRTAGGEPNNLTSRQTELLRVPLHLALYLQGDVTKQGGFETVQDLYARYWDRKQCLVRDRLGRPVQWTEVIDPLCEYLSDRQVLAAHHDILDKVSTDAQAMASEHVLVLENSSYRFFHEGFFDYAFARRFVQHDGNVIGLLTQPDQEQHLFRRSQVNQILAYQRGRDRPAYLRDLRNVLSDGRVRFHIKKALLDWLGQLEDPTAEEWAVLNLLLAENQFRTHVTQAIVDRPAWFDVLDRAGVWATWLASPQPDEVNEAVWLLSMPKVLQQHSQRIAALVRPFMEAGSDWLRRLRGLVGRGEVYHSREMMDLFLALIDSGALDDAL